MQGQLWNLDLKIDSKLCGPRSPSIQYIFFCITLYGHRPLISGMNVHSEETFPEKAQSDSSKLGYLEPCTLGTDLILPHSV